MTELSSSVELKLSFLFAKELPLAVHWEKMIVLSRI